MKKLTLIVWMFTAALSASADHWIGPREVVQAARQVDNQARFFHDLVHELTGLGHLADDAHKLARDADQLRDRVERGAGFQAVLPEYHQLQHSFEHLDQYFDQNFASHQNWRIRYHWHSVSYSFHKLDWAMTQGNGSLSIDVETPGHRHSGP